MQLFCSHNPQNPPLTPFWHTCARVTETKFCQQLSRRLILIKFWGEIQNQSHEYFHKPSKLNLKSASFVCRKTFHVPSFYWNFQPEHFEGYEMIFNLNLKACFQNMYVDWKAKVVTVGLNYHYKNSLHSNRRIIKFFRKTKKEYYTHQLQEMSGRWY